MNKESEALVQEWLNEYKSLADASVASYAGKILKREDILKALMDLFRIYTNAEKPDTVTNNLLQPVCHQLFEFYRSGHKELKYFAINLFPSIILSHIIISSGSIETTPTDTLILSVYSLENKSINETESPGIEIPQLQYPSIYHDPMSGVFSEQTVKDRNSGRRYYHKPYLPDYKVIIPFNRFQIMTRVLTVYCEHVSVMKKISLLSLCSACTYLASCGYLWQTKYLSDKDRESFKPIQRRIPLGVDFIMMVLRGVYFAMYNHCLKEALSAVESMHTRATAELTPQPIFLCNAILDTAKMEADERQATEGAVSQKEEIPYGLSSLHLTPMLTRENSRRGKNRNAATARSIRDHKWSHRSEEISGDLSRSLQSPEIHVHPPKGGPPTISENEESGKTEKHTTSPSKLLKSKLKKSAASGSPLSGAAEKLKSPAPSGEKKNKKLQTDKSLEDADEKQKNSPMLKRTPSKKSPQMTRKQSKTALQKQHSLDDGAVHSTAPKSKMPVSKSTSDSISPAVTGKGIQNSVSLEASYNSSDGSPSKQNTSTTVLLEVTKQLDTSTESEGRDTSNDERSKETYPLLPTSEQSSTKHHNGTQQTML